MTTLAWLLFAAIALAQSCGAYKILVVFPMVARSHGILGEGIVKYLLQAGHEVTYVTPHPVMNPPSNLRVIDINYGKVAINVKDILNVTSILQGKVSMDLGSLMTFMDSLNEEALMNPNFQKLMSDTSQNFDVVIGEWLYGEIYAGLGYLFNCPFIWSSSKEPHWLVLRLIDENTHPAYVPHMSSYNIPPFSMMQRVEELFTQIMGMAVGYLKSYQHKQFEKILGPHIIKRGKPLVPFDVVKYNASLVLGNSHVSLGQATRLPQAYIPIGGYHIDTVVKPLPGDLKKLIENARNGLIYFSMGTNIKSNELPESIKKDLLEVFGGLKQTILWKFEEVLPNLPKNVHIVDWAPQQSILAHPNCILFITHGGLLSTTEAVHFGKPIIGIPVITDQFSIINRAVKKGFARRVDLSYNMKDELRAAIDDVLHDKRYTEKARELSLVYHDRPVHPSKELVHWVEHVIKTRGAPHLRSPALDVPVYQKLYLDLLALVLMVLYVIMKIVTSICCLGRTVNKEKKN